MYDPRTSLTRQVSQQLEQFFGDRVFKTVFRGIFGWQEGRAAGYQYYGMIGYQRRFVILGFGL